MKDTAYIEGHIIYVAHPYGGNKENIKSAGECIEKITELYPDKTIFSPLHNWSWDIYDKSHQEKPIQDCLRMLHRCDAIIFCKDWKKSMGCMQEYAAAFMMGIPTFEFNERTVEEIE